MDQSIHQKFAARKKKKKDGTSLSDVAIPGAAAAAGGAAGIASISDPEKQMGKKMQMERLREKIRPGDIILSGRKSTYSHLDKSEYKSPGQKAFWHGLKPGTGSYAPHGLVVTETGTRFGSKKNWYLPKLQRVTHQAERVSQEGLSSYLSGVDRIVVLRPKKPLTKEQFKKVRDWTKGHAKGSGSPYGNLLAAGQGVGGLVLPKRLRDLCTKTQGKMMCTAFPARAYEQAGAPVVKGKARATLSKDLLASKKMNVVGWSGADISKQERRAVRTLPRAVRGAAWAGAAGAGAYGIKKLVDWATKKKQPKAKAPKVTNIKKIKALKDLKKTAAKVRARAASARYPAVESEMKTKLRRVMGEAPRAPKSIPSGSYGL